MTEITMDIVNQISEFYRQHEKLAISLVSIIATWVLTKFGPALYFFIMGLFRSLRKMLGGRFAYKNIQDKYLNWVVMQNQDLNLTGIIGTGQKPKLEQVFISLKIIEETETRNNKKRVDDQKGGHPINTQKRILNRIREKWTDNFLQYLKLFYHRFESISNGSDLVIFKPARLWKIWLFFSRDRMDEVLILSMIVILLVILPSYGLLGAKKVSSFIVGISSCALSIAIVMAIASLWYDYKKKSLKSRVVSSS